ncbi:MAG: hypothetical protein PHW52_01555 [Candidatus Pacebacteria bacterium]|nr:hypothetical protein [Candidatus Paceibacterota bacterium]
MQKKAIIIVAIAIMAIAMLSAGCTSMSKSDSGVEKASVSVATDPSGHSIEQNNIIERYKRDNEIGSYKYLYVINAYTNDVVYMSTVKGKVTSSGKRLTPRALAGGQWNNGAAGVMIAGNQYETTEVIEDDGTYGDSVPYIYWFDGNDVYHQQYINGGSIIHVSDQPLVLPKAVLDISMKSK